MRAHLQLLAILVVTCAIGACSTDRQILEPNRDGGSSPDGSSPRPHDLSWLEANMVPIRTVEPDDDLSDLMPLREIIGDARIVALGEGTHGTREFFRMKHRLLRFLVQEMGFDLFAIEAGLAEAKHIDRYVRTGEGDPVLRLSDMGYWPWNTQEVLDMIGWMREYNIANPDAIGFLGFDMQLSKAAISAVVRFLYQVDMDLMVEAQQAYHCWRIWQNASTYPFISDSIQSECRTGIETVYEMLASRRAEFIAATTAEEYEYALRAARIVVQHEHKWSDRWRDDHPNPRDLYMAENVAWMLDQAGPDSRIVLWAHNLHVWDTEDWMGGYLRPIYGDEMVVVGLSFHDGEFNAIPQKNGRAIGPVGPHASGPPIPDSYEDYFGYLDEPRFLVDLRPLRNDLAESTEWLRGSRPFRSIGSSWDGDHADRYYLEIPLHERFDLWIHFDSTTATTLLPFITD